MNVGFAMCGSFCTFSKVFPVMERLAENHQVFPIFSFASASTDSRFGTAAEFLERAERICGRPVIQAIAGAEPIGPKKLLDVLVIAPCTGNTLAKLSRSIADTPVTMAAKSHLRNGRPVLVAVSTNNGLAPPKTSDVCWRGSTIISFPTGRMTRNESPPLWWPILS